MFQKYLLCAMSHFTIIYRYTCTGFFKYKCTNSNYKHLAHKNTYSQKHALMRMCHSKTSHVLSILPQVSLSTSSCVCVDRLQDQVNDTQTTKKLANINMEAQARMHRFFLWKRLGSDHTVNIPTIFNDSLQKQKICHQVRCTQDYRRYKWSCFLSSLILMKGKSIL